MSLPAIYSAAQAIPTIMSLFSHGKESNPYAGDLRSLSGRYNDLAQQYGGVGKAGFDIGSQFRPEFTDAAQKSYQRWMNLADNGLTDSERAMLLGTYLGPGHGTMATSQSNNIIAQLAQRGLAGSNATGDNSSVAGAVRDASLAQSQNLNQGQAKLGETEFNLPFTALANAQSAAQAPLQYGDSLGFEGYGRESDAYGNQSNIIRQLQSGEQQQRDNQVQSDQATMSGAGGLANTIMQIYGQSGGKKLPFANTGGSGNGVTLGGNDVPSTSTPSYAPPMNPYIPSGNGTGQPSFADILAYLKGSAL